MLMLSCDYIRQEYDTAAYAYRNHTPPVYINVILKNYAYQKRKQQFQKRNSVYNLHYPLSCYSFFNSAIVFDG